MRADVLRRPSVVAGGVWLAFYLAVALTGERFSTGYLDYGWQMVPWDILSSDPLRSVWYLHVQPPLWNLTLGVVGWASPANDGITFQVLMAAIGVVLAGLCARLARVIGLRPGAAVVLAVAATAHPEVLRTAFEPTYELAVAALLVASVLVLEAWWRRPTRRAALIAAGCLTVVVLTRSLYHPVWLVVMLAIVPLALRRTDRAVPWRTLGLAALVPVVLIGGWMAKNDALFGRPTLSSWFGMNLQRAVIPVLDADELQAMYADGEVSIVAIQGPFRSLDVYQALPAAARCTPAHTHRSVSEPGRTTNEFSPNFNDECYLPVFDQAGRDAVRVIRSHPAVWVEGRLWSARVWFAVSTLPAGSESSLMRGLDAIYSLARVDVTSVLSTTGWGTPIYGTLVVPSDFGLVPVALTVLVAALGVRAGWRILRRRPGSVVLAAAGGIVVFTFVAGVVGELGEQARFRTMIDPLVWVVALGVLLRRTDLGQPQADGDAR